MHRHICHACVHGLSLVIGLVGGVTAVSPCGATEPTADAKATASSTGPAPGHWQWSGLQVEVSATSSASVNAKAFPALAHYAVGVAAVPITLLQPPSALGLPFYILLAAPWQASFNAQRASLVAVFTALPLTQATADAMRSQWPVEPVPVGSHIQLRIDSYGLQTRSGRSLDAFDEHKEDLCLTAQAHLQVVRAGRPSDPAPLRIELQAGAAGEPPALCAPLSKWADQDATLLRQGILELAEVLAALTLQRWEAAP